MRHIKLIISILFYLLICNCNDRIEKYFIPDIETDAFEYSDTSIIEDIYLWDFKNPPDFETNFLKNIQDILNISVWHTRAEENSKPTGGKLGSFGIGNGVVFGFVGLTYPLNTLHSLCGPYYEKDDRFFGDITIEFFENDNLINFEKEYVMRSLAGPINIIIESRSNLHIEILDFTPLLNDKRSPLKNNYFRVIAIKNKGQHNNFFLYLKTANYQKFEKNLLIEEKKNAILSSFFIIPEQENTNILFENGRYGINLSNMSPLEERIIYLVHHISGKDSDIFSDYEDIKKNLSILGLLKETIDNYKNLVKNTTQIKTPDIAVNHLIEGLKLTLKTQIGENGAAAPMSEYTRVWTRDLTGWVFGLLSIGGFEDVKKIITYLHYAISKGGDIKNSYPADLDISEPVVEPNWDEMPPLSEKASAEVPSHIPIYHHLYYEYTGDLSLFEKNKNLIKRALLAQNISKDGLIPFSGDETFRAAMNAAFGLPLEYPHHQNSYSPNSSILFIRAAKGSIHLFDLINDFENKQLIKEKLTLVENAFYKYFILPNNCISAFIDINNSSQYKKPFEDESLTLSFLGNNYFNSDTAIRSFKCLLEEIHIDNGVLLSQIDEKYKDFLGFKVRKGILTGMLPGYTLSAFTKNNHPEATDAFNQIRRYADTSGNFGEYLIFDDQSTISLIYDPNGKQGDYTARFRPWEGGINLYSIIKFLIGFNVSKTEKKITIRPHLPNNWNFLEVENIRFDHNKLSLSIHKKSNKFSISINSLEDSEYELEIIIDFPADYYFLTDKDIHYSIKNGPFGINSAIIKAGDIKKGNFQINYRITQLDL